MRRIRPGLVPLVGVAALAALAIILGAVGRGPSTVATPTHAAFGSQPLPTAGPTAAAPTDIVEPTIDPASVEPCADGDLAMLAGGWSGATGSMGGGASVVNVSSDVCAVSGQPAVELRDRRNKVIATGAAATPGEPVALLPGGVAGVIIVWQNWCGDPPPRPLAVRLSLSTGVILDSPVADWDNVGAGGATPRCDAEGAPSDVGALPFEAAEPPDLGEITSDPCRADDLAAFLGPWGAAAGTAYASVTVFNRSGVGCVLPDAPRLILRDADDKLLATGEPGPDPAEIDLPSGRATQTYIGFADWCLPQPSLPFELDLRFEDALLEIAPTSERSRVGVPPCQSDPPAAAPMLFLTNPFPPPR